MKRAIKQKPKAVKATKPTETQPAVICGRVECENPLRKRQKTFCSRECQYLAMREGEVNLGQPTKYKPEFAGEVFNKYIEYCEAKNQADMIPTSTSYLIIQNAHIPTLDDYAEFLAREGHIDYVATSTLVNWANTHVEFARAVARLNRIQKIWLLNNGLAGKYNPAVTKMQLNVNHGMVERKQVDNTHKMLGVVKHVYGRADEIEEERRQQKIIDVEPEE